MGVIITSNSDYGKELAKWEQFPTPWAPVPGRPFVKSEFPLMLYKAHMRMDGKASVGETDDHIFGGAPGIAEQWTRQCQRIVNDDSELERAKSEGWRRNPQEALEVYEKRMRFMETAAAHRAYEDRNMSEAAKKEAAEAEEAVPTHVAEVPQKPVVKRPSLREAKPDPDPEEKTEVLLEPPAKRAYVRKAQPEPEITRQVPAAPQPVLKRKYVRKAKP